MAQDFISAILGGQPDYASALSPEQMQQLRTNANLNAAIGAIIPLLSLSGPQARPVGTGQALGAALGGAFGGYNQGFDRTLQQIIAGQQLEEVARKRQSRQRYQDIVKGATKEIPQFGLVPTETGEMPTEQTATALTMPLAPKKTIDFAKLQEGALEYAATEDPLKFLELTAKAEKAPSSVQEYEYAVKNGFKGSFTDYMAKKTPGTNVTVKTGEGIVAQVGPMLKDAQIQAQGANIQIDAADRVIGAVNTGKIIAGPLATPQLKLAQIGQVLGVTGKDTAEVIANTRQAIRGFAELTLQGRKSMRGEGAITESEGKLAERAFSGDIDTLTAQEIKQIANASKRVAEYSITEYNRKLDIVAKNPEMKDVVDLYRVTPIQPMRQGNVKKFNPATGKVE
jgi:hypothetical protein